MPLRVRGLFIDVFLGLVFLVLNNWRGQSVLSTFLSDIHVYKFTFIHTFNI